MDMIRSYIEDLNVFIGSSTFGRIFRLEGSGHVSPLFAKLEDMLMFGVQDMEIRNTRFSTELRAGLTTFFTMAYIIAVNVSTKHPDNDECT
jgi:AGZA family xanthine/uracil permease-like MFS transporter